TRCASTWARRASVSRAPHCARRSTTRRSAARADADRTADRCRSPPMPMCAWTEGFRALLYTAALEEDIANAGPEAERSDARDLVEWLLPLVKAGASDAGFRVANQAIQLHGGHGYVFEHGVEQLARDVRIAAIYEGANAIQAIDLV